MKHTAYTAMSWPNLKQRKLLSVIKPLLNAAIYSYLHSKLAKVSQKWIGIQPLLQTHQRAFWGKAYSVYLRNKMDWGPFYLHGLTVIPAWISNFTQNQVRYEISYPFPNFNMSHKGISWPYSGHSRVYDFCRIKQQTVVLSYVNI